MKRYRRVIAGAALLVTFAAGWIAAAAFQSPAQREADAAPPEPGPILAPVRLGQLEDLVVGRAEIGPAASIAWRPASVPANPTITATNVEAGDVVEAGDAPLAINGRPVIALPGSFPFYRDLVVGDTGADVVQLQNGLRAAGYVIGDREAGVFGADTSRAVRTMYRAVGFEPSTRLQQPTSPEAQPITVTVVLLTELAVARTLPATVGSVAAVGATAGDDGPLITLVSGGLVARASLPVGVALRVEPGMSVVLRHDGGTEVVAAVTAVNESGEADPGQAIVVLSGLEALPAEWAGANVLVQITVVERVESALIVPSAAVSSNADGSAFVTRAIDGGERFERVLVNELDAIAGESAVEPVEPESLSAGDLVRVG